MTDPQHRGVSIRHVALVPAPPGRQPEIHVEIVNHTGSPAGGTLCLSRLAGPPGPAATFGFHFAGDRTTAVLWQPDDPGDPAAQTLICSDAPWRIILSADAAGQVHHDEFVINPPARDPRPRRPQSVARRLIDPNTRRGARRLALAL